jgi:glycosyltransferase involved in cell wall biosynthesis
LKVLFISTLYAPYFVGGAERVLQTLAEGLVEIGHQVVIVCTAPQKSTRIEWINGVKVYYVDLKNLYWPFGDNVIRKPFKPLWHALDTLNPCMAREVKRILSAEQPNIVHTNNLAGFSVLTWQIIKRQRLPLVHTIHDYYLLCPRSTMFRNEKNCTVQCSGCYIYSLPRSRRSNQVDAVVGVSRFILEHHLRFGYFAATAEKKVIFNPYEAALRPPSDTRSLPIRLGYLGRLSGEKGVEAVLQAVMQLPTGTCKLDIAGQGVSSYERYLRAKYRVPAITFLGYVEPDTFLHSIDVLIVPSVWNEPFGRIIIEAYASGVPVVASKRGGIPELVEDGVTGYLFDPGNPGDLRAKMTRCIDEPALINSMRSACLERATNFSTSRIVEQYLKVYAGEVRGA